MWAEMNYLIVVGAVWAALITILTALIIVGLRWLPAPHAALECRPTTEPTALGPPPPGSSWEETRAQLASLPGPSWAEGWEPAEPTRRRREEPPQAATAGPAQPTEPSEAPPAR